ncbi:Calx-beta domain-containing protein [Pedobacter chitinilyticus]|uniref:T9SS type B sorting domain-containing protein n=1 Tax=Pedobacter chitinilyticus TaxID=2233776 RepID=A0A3S3R5C7_9SPHI|nr:Calx-beta domain-containing protein [Pedobacter chitinilyticus]RWU06147.1 T9SS type B sorting domain-containing protein [Pedobacter chitinilyticus]
MKKTLLICLLVLFAFQLRAADYYWVGGSGNWSQVNLHWSSTSGGVPNRSIVPGTGDDVYFDANSGLDASSVIILPTSGNAVCRNMSWVGVTAAATFRSNTSNSILELQIYGNLELAASVKYGMTNVKFLGSGNATYKTNGAQRISTNWYNQLLVNKAGGSLKLLDGIPETLGIGAITLNEGGLDLSGNSHEINRFYGNFTTTRSLNLSNATLKASIEFNFNATNGTLLSTGSNLITEAFTSNGLTFNNVEVTGTAAGPTITNTTFNELLFSNPNSIAGSVRIGLGNKLARLEFKGGGRIESGNNVIDKLILAPSKGYVFRESITVNQLFQFNTPDCDALGQLLGGPAININMAAGAVADVQNVLLTNMVISGTGTPLTVQGADGGGNTGFNIQPRASGTTLYWVGGAGSWDDKSHWALTSGGAGGACVPFTGDNVIFDANSGFTAASKTVTVAGAAWCHNVTWTNVANAPIFNTGTAILEVYGNIELDPTLTISGILLSQGSEQSTLTTKGANLGTLSLRIYKATNAALTVTDNINFPQLSIVHTRGGLLMPNRTINMYTLNSSGNGRTVDISNATITVSENWTVGAGGSTWINNAVGSFVTSNRIFVTNGFSYPKVHLNTAENVVNIVNTTINELVFNNPSPTSSTFVLNGAGGNTIGTLDIKSGGVTLMGNNTINNLLLTPSRVYNFRNTQTITGLLRFNNPGCEGLGELRGYPGTSATLNFGPAATKDFNNVYVQNMAATGTGVPISISGADAGGNTGFVFTASAGGARYWVGGSGDWNESAHWSTTSGGAGGACVPTVSNDVFFDANSFTAGSSAVTISQGNAYCRNMDWTGVTNAPTFTKPAGLTLEIWGNLVLSPALNPNIRVAFMGPTNATFTPNNATLGTLGMDIIKPGSSLTFTGDLNNPNAVIVLNSGGLNLNGRTITASVITDESSTLATNLDIRNATINAKWQYTGTNKSLQASGSTVIASVFRTNGETYNKVDVTTNASQNIGISQTTIADLLFSNNSNTSQAVITGNNTIGRLEFKGKGFINGTGNTIETLIFAPGKIYTFLSGSTNTITKDWFGSGTPCNLTEINGSATGAFTVNKTTGGVEFDYVRLRNITAAGTTPFKALEHSEDLGGNTNWTISPYNNTTPILGLGPDKLLCASEYPYTIKTDGFFASPMATFAWGDGSTGTTFSATVPGTYTVTVSYPDGCSRTDEIVLTRSDVVIAPITGTANVCTTATTTLSSATAGGVWSSSNTAVATVSALGVVTGVTAGTADIIYTVTNGNGCVGAVQQTVTVNAMPTVATTTGASALFVGDNITLANTTVGGVWSSSNTAIATVDVNGVVTGVAAGTANIIYTVTGTGNCVATNTHAITVDAFDPAKRVLSVTKTTDAAEPITNGAFTISLPAGVNALENITVTYAVTGTATAGSDYTALTGTATILAGQNSVSVPVNVMDDAQIEPTETVILTLSAGTSTTYTYTLSPTANNASLNISDDDDLPANRVLSVTAQLNANEPSNTGTFTVALPTGVLAPENITVAYTLSGSAINGTDYQSLTGTATILAGQNNVVINVTAIDDQIIEQTKDIILTLTGGTTTSSGIFGVHATNGVATLLQADNDYIATTRLLAVTSNGNAAEPGTHSSFTISLPTGYVSALPITVTYALSGTATYGADYSSVSATTITLPAGQNSVNVPINVINDGVIEPTETVILTITNGVAMQGATTVFSFSPNPAAPNASMNIADNDNTASNRTLSVSAQNGAEPATNGSFTVSLPSGVTASENINLNYNLTGTATSAVDYRAITGAIVIPAGQNSVEVPLIIIDDKVIEGTETVIFNLASGTSTNFNFTASSSANSATAQIADDDAAANTTVVLLTKVSDAVEGGAAGQYRISLPPGVTSAEAITINYNTTGTATTPADYTLGNVTGNQVIIPAGDNEVFVSVNALADAVVEGPETVILNLTSASSPSTPYTIDPTGNGAVVTIVDMNATSSTALQLTAAVNGAEPASNGSFNISLAGGLTANFPITVGYSLSGNAIVGQDYKNFGTITIPANQNSITIPVEVLDDKIIEGTETVTFTILSGSAINGGTAYTFPAASASGISVTITDDDTAAGNRVLAVAKIADAAEPDQAGSFTVSLPTGYTSSSNITLSYTMSGTATRNTDYTIATVTFPANTNSVTLPVLVIDDQLLEPTETVTLTLNNSADGNGFTYTPASGANAATLNIADDDNTPANRMLSVVGNGNATEGGATGSFIIKLPTGVTTASNTTVNYTLGGTASATDYNPLTGTATIVAGQNAVAIVITAVDDNIIEPTENIALTITGGTDGTNAYTAAVGSETASIDIIDNDANVDAKRTLAIVRTAHAAEPATNGGFRVQLPTGITSAEDVTVNYTVAGTATAGADYKALTGTIVLPAGQNQVALPVEVIDDQIMEVLNETVMVTLTDGASPSFAFPITAVAAQKSTSLNIADDDNTATNRTLTLTKISDAAEPSTNGMFRVSLPPNVVCAANVNITQFTTGSTATAGTDYQAISPVILLAGQNYVDIPIRVIDDKIIENTETVRMALSGTSTAGFPYIFTLNTTPVVMNITDDDNIPANRIVNATVNRNGAEGGNSLRFDFTLPPGISSSEQVVVNYTVTGSAVNGVDYTPLASQFTGVANILANSTAGTTIEADIIDDTIIEGMEDVIITITSVTSPSFAFTFGGPATGTITDNDHLPANLVLAVTKTADAVEGGANGEFTISLPGTTTTATEAITVNYTLTGTATNGTDYTALTGSVVIPAGDHEVKIPVSANVDQIIEGTETVILTITGGNSTSFAFTPSTTNASATVDITDATNTPVNRTLSIAKLNDAAEPGTSGRVSIALPTGITATENISVSYTVGGTATAGTDYAALTGTATILAGQNGVIVPISVIDDQLIEQTETVTLTLTSGTSTNFAFTATGNVTVNIADDDNIPANLVLNVTKTADAAEPSTAGNFNIALPVGITVPTDLTVNYTVTGTAAAGSDYTAFTGVVTIPAGSNSVDLALNVIDDQEVEGTETVTLTVTSGTATGLVFTAGTSETIDIADDDNIPANLVVSIAKAADAAEPATDGRFSVSLPAGVTVSEDITVNYTVAGTATAGTDYTALSGTVTIPAGQNSVNILATIIDDQIIEGTETIVATLTNATSTSFSLTATGSATVSIADDENTVANRTVTIAKTADAAEPASPGNFAISLPTGITAKENITVNYTVGGTATAGTDYTVLTGTATILAGQNAVNVAVNVIDDKIVEGTETVTATLTSASSASLSFTATGSASLNIADDDNTAANKMLAITKTADAAEPATQGNFNISLPTGITAKENITVNYTVGGTATAGTDYTALTGTATILAGQNSVNVPLMVIDDNVYEPLETVILTLTGGTSANFSFTPAASNTATANITDNDKMDQVITFTALPNRILGDPSFTLTATGGASGNPVTFTSSNPAVAMVSGNVVTIVGVGTVTITASQAGNAIYHAAADVPQSFTVIPPLNTAPTLAAIANQQVCLTNAPQSIALSGISAGIEATQTTTLSVSASNPSLFSALSVTQLTAGNGVLNYTLSGAVGTTTITVTVRDNGGTANGGVDVFTRTFTLTASALPQVQVVAKPGTTVSKGQTIELTASGASTYTWSTAAGVIPGQTSATLNVRPAQNTTYTVTGTNASGCTSTATITITVIEDFKLEGNNVLTPNGDGKNDFFVIKNIDMYPNNEVRIFDRAGRPVYTKRGYNNEWDGTLNGKPLEENTYYYIIDLGKGVKPIRGYITIVRKY